MFPRLMGVKAPSTYKLQLRFDDGTEGIVDVSSLAGKGVFSAWDDDDLFLNPYINEMGGISWGDWLDLDPHNAYLTLKGITFDDWKRSHELNSSKAPIVRIDSSLEEYRDKVMFPEKLAKANEMLKTAKLPGKKRGN